MGLVPKLVGGIEVRERKPRYEGEPRYKRLDFIKHKSRPKNDEYTLIKTTYPRPQAPQYGAPWDHPQWNALSYEQQRQLLAELGYQQPPPPYHPLQAQRGGHGGPPPPPSHHGLEGHNPHLIEPADALPEGMVRLESSDDSDSEPEYSIKVIKPKPKRPSGHTVFGSDSEDDRSTRYRSSNGSTITTISSVGSSVSSRRRGAHRKGMRGWGG